MKRITPEEVVEAYRATGLRPRTCRADYTVDGNCCAIGALAAFAEVKSGEIYPWIANLVGLQYLENFVRGFDGCVYHDGFDRDAFNDGAEARKAVIAAGMEFVR